jgi:hypothetical protein
MGGRERLEALDEREEGEEGKSESTRREVDRSRHDGRSIPRWDPLFPRLYSLFVLPRWILCRDSNSAFLCTELSTPLP